MSIIRFSSHPSPNHHTHPRAGAALESGQAGFAFPFHAGNSDCRTDGSVSRRGTFEATSKHGCPALLYSRSRQRGAQTRAERSLPVPPQEH